LGSSPSPSVDRWARRESARAVARPGEPQERTATGCPSLEAAPRATPPPHGRPDPPGSGSACGGGGRGGGGGDGGGGGGGRGGVDGGWTVGRGRVRVPSLSQLEPECPPETCQPSATVSPRLRTVVGVRQCAAVGSRLNRAEAEAACLGWTHRSPYHAFAHPGL